MEKDEKPKNVLETIWITLEIFFQKRPIMIFLSLIILALTFWTYFGLFYFLNNMTRPVQTVTVSSEGPAAEIYPDSMGQYNVLREVYRYDRAVYKHVDREDRFIIYTGRNTGLY